jgi:hypothetical protein
MSLETRVAKLEDAHGSCPRCYGRPMTIAGTDGPLEAACHDCRRRSAGRDDGHGERAAAWFGEHAPQLAPGLTPAQVAQVQYCVLWHVPGDRHCPHLTPELRCLKDADGLDRVRLGDFDPQFLRLPYLRERQAAAEALYQASHPDRPGDPWELVRAAAQAQGLWPVAEVGALAAPGVA